MSNIFDYLEWRGDISFDEDPFNEVDNLVLSELAYADFEGVVPCEKGSVPVGKVRDAFFAKYPRSLIHEDSSHIAKAPLLMDGMASGRRFGTARMTGYADIVDTDEVVQMAAVTFLLSDGTAYVAFRGTDSTVVGWKEDFNMSWLPETEGQRRAVEYLNVIGRRIRRPLRVGGHSKGGNFAVYASAFCSRSVRDRIIGVYTNDGPGFRPEVMESVEYKSILPKVISIVPDTSVIGMLLTSDVRHRYIKSSGKGLEQHDALTWQVVRDRFASSEPSELGLFIMKSQKDWLSKLGDRDRELFVNTLFSLFEATGMETFDQMAARRLKAASDMISGMKAMPKDRRKEMTRIIAELLRSGGETAWETLTDRAAP